MWFAEGLERISSFAFFETDIVNVVFPATLKTIAQGAFAKCSNLKTAKFNEGLEVLGTDEYQTDGGLYYGVF